MSDLTVEVVEAVEALLVVGAILGLPILVEAGKVSDLLAEVEEVSEALLAVVAVLIADGGVLAVRSEREYPSAA